MPARVPWIVRRGESNRERAEIAPRPPSAWTDKLVECPVQDGRIGRRRQGLLSVRTETDHRLRPGCWVGLIAARIAPEDGTAFVRKLARKSHWDFHEPIV